MTKIKFPNGQIVDFKDRSREDILEQINALEETHPQLFKSEVEPKEVVVEIFPLSEYVSPNQTDGGDLWQGSATDKCSCVSSCNPVAFKSNQYIITRS